MELLDKEKVEKRKRKKPSQENEINIKLIPVSQKHPERKSEDIIVLDEYGYSIVKSCVVLDHILDDLQTLGHSRVRYWGELPCWNQLN